MAQIVYIESASTTKKRQRKYKCPFCDARYIRSDLVSHVNRKHEDMIPEGYTALHLVYDYINNKHGHGDCRMCKEPTAWNETKGRYEILCGRQACKDAFRKQSQKHYEDTYGSSDPANDPRYKEEMQKRAIANKKTSGTYTFSDGGKIGYNGSYERKFLEFLDKILHVLSTDIQSPAPVIYYQFDGKEHLYIPDFYYIPYNLIVEIKDGGAKDRWQESAAKMKAKEEAIRDGKKYNYIRLADNDFAKLMEIFAILKYTMGTQDSDELIVQTESVAGAAAIPNTNLNAKNFYIIQYMNNNVYDYAITNDELAKATMHLNDRNIVESISNIPNGYRIFRLDNWKQARNVFEEALRHLKSKATYPAESFYERYTGEKMIFDGQLLSEATITEVNSIDTTVLEIEQSVMNYIHGGRKKSYIDIAEQMSYQLMDNIDAMMESIGSEIYDVQSFISVLNDKTDQWEDIVNNIRIKEDNMCIVMVDTRYPSLQIKDYSDENIAYIDRKWQAFQSLSNDMRSRSNDLALALVGLDNNNLYAIIKSLQNDK